MASFATVAEAADAVVASAAPCGPSMMELMDRASINAVEDFRPMGLDRRAGALLVAQSDAPGAARGRGGRGDADGVRGRRRHRGLRDRRPRGGRAFVAARRAAFPAIEAKGSLLLEDVGARSRCCPALLAEIAAIARCHDVEIPVVAHAGDGNTHPIIVFDPTDPAAERRARAAFDEVMHAAIRLGGTITGEHGVGRAKKAALPDQLGPDVMALTRRVKDALDPDGILNPGAIL